MASASDSLAQLFQPASAPPPAPVTLNTPEPPKPAVLIAKPRLRPADGGSAVTGKPSVDAPTVPGGGGGKTGGSAGSSGGKFNSYLSDVAGGIQSVPANASAISAFAYGFAGAIKSSDARRRQDKIDKEHDQDRALALEDRAAAKTQQQFNNDITLTNAGKNGLVGSTGELTASGLIQLDKDVNDYAMSNGLRGATPADMDAADKRAQALGFKNANDMLDQYRQQRVQEYRQAYGYKGDAPKGPGGKPQGSLPKPTSPPPGVDPGSGNWVQDRASDAWKWVTDRATDVASAVGGMGGGNPKDALAGTPQANGADTDHPPQGGKTPAAGAKAALPKGISGSGSEKDPFRGFTDDPQSVAAWQQTVPVGGYFVYADPITGEESVRRRSK